ncbi:LamG-like jellyroll fold domain-containing protein [Spirosoma fluviale]|uniref:PKD repeat-containing protein n=1 Tax=Spirosoma fluviale TaxID=1597977 RepID=A0A286F8D6_9BACT|nr:LamG-like jellyroll fold domain-containing protein [Spirosoma fluviale]SOD79488.1 PKD repeat-containing protein [Spirosoma fluviale]
MNRFFTYVLCFLLACSSGVLILSCNPWDLPTKKSQRECVKPSGTLNAQSQQRIVDFSISGSSGTIDKVIWDFGNNATAVTTGLTTKYTYPANGTYTVKATLTNSCGLETTLQQVITVSDAVPPTVTLQAITTVFVTSATAGMTITANGNATITRYGVCYSATKQLPEVDAEQTSSFFTTAPLNAALPVSLTGLQPNTLYYARSFATNSAGTGYSQPVQQFRSGQRPSVSSNGTPATGTSTATVGFVLNNAGNPAAVEYGICYSSTNTTPDVATSSVTIVTSPAVGATVPVNLSNLTPNKTYYYRPYAKLPSGEVVYGDVMTFTTLVDTVSQDLIASVSFTDRSLQDVSGFNNHVKLVNNPTFTTDHNGRANSAILLNGSGDYFYMEDNNTLNPDAMTVSLWIKPEAIVKSNDRMQIYNKSRFSDGLPQTYSSLIKLENDIGPAYTFMTDIKQNSNCEGGKGWQDLAFTSPVVLNTWYHLVFTYSGRSARMYFNNVLVFRTDNLPATTIDKCPGGELKFGAQYQSLPWYFKGAMDDIRIYKRAITAAEVETLFKQ